ncbi:MAG: MFS transporter [Vulcanimicrobiaceae bacterium]
MRKRRPSPPFHDPAGCGADVTFARVVAARALRNAAYGWLSVVLAVALAERGLTAAGVGAILTVALMAGAVFSFGTGALVERLGRRTTLVLAALAMAATGALLALARDPALLVFAAVLGTLSPGGQEVGPFAAIEQAAIAEATPDERTRRYATYNIVGTFAAAGGALVAAIAPSETLLWAYGGAGLGLAALYATTFPRADAAARRTIPAIAARRPRAPRVGVVERLTLLFGLDALAGGFAVQSFIAYWLHLRFGVGPHALGLLFFGTNVLAALSLLAAARLAERIGLLATMVATHLPSNAFLFVVPLMPSFPLAAAALLARSALSQMDVPTRQAYTMALVPAAERTRAAGLTAAVRPAAAAVAPVLAGLALQSVAFGLPFYLAGGLKIVYDLLLFATFRNVAPSPEALRTRDDARG